MTVAAARSFWAPLEHTGWPPTYLLSSPYRMEKFNSSTQILFLLGN